jgi:hypothetical protein
MKMAKVSAHGTEIGTIYFTTSAKRYMSDGVVLKNQGFGWKLAGKVKDMTPQEAFEHQRTKQIETLSDKPATVAYRKMLHSLAGLGKRWKLHAAVSMMPDDPDGVWSEACDSYGDNVEADIDDCSQLCALYRQAVQEAKDIKRRNPTKLETAEA